MIVFSLNKIVHIPIVGSTMPLLSTLKLNSLLKQNKYENTYLRM